MLLQKLGELSPELRYSRSLRPLISYTPHPPHEHGHRIRPRGMVHVQARGFEGRGAQEAEAGAEVALYGVGFGDLLPFAIFLEDSEHGELLQRRGGFLGFPILCHNQIWVMG